MPLPYRSHTIVVDQLHQVTRCRLAWPTPSPVTASHSAVMVTYRCTSGCPACPPERCGERTAAQGLSMVGSAPRTFQHQTAQSRTTAPINSRVKISACDNEYADPPCLKSRSRFLLLCTPRPAANTLRPPPVAGSATSSARLSSLILGCPCCRSLSLCLPINPSWARSQRSMPSLVHPCAAAILSTWSLPILPTAKYCASG